MYETKPEAPTTFRKRASTKKASGSFVPGFHGVRYQVRDVGRSVEFYTSQLGFKLEHQKLPQFANVTLGGLTLHLSGPGASGSRPLPDGRQQAPGGWNRIVLEVDDLQARIEDLRKEGLNFRNEMETGPAGKQIQMEDPDGNAIELFEPNRKAS
jgi:glyoxylase I family protein